MAKYVYVKVGRYLINNQLRDIYFKTNTEDYGSARTAKKYHYYIPWKSNKNIQFYIGSNDKI